jgi:hypothetical protein
VSKSLADAPEKYGYRVLKSDNEQREGAKEEDCESNGESDNVVFEPLKDF